MQRKNPTMLWYMCASRHNALYGPFLSTAKPQGLYLLLKQALSHNLLQTHCYQSAPPIDTVGLLLQQKDIFLLR